MTGRLANQLALVTGGSRGIGRATCLALDAEGARLIVHYRQNRAAADGRKKCDFVPGGKRGAPFGKFLVHGGHHRRPESGQLRETVPIARKQILDAGAFGDLGTLLRSANDVF